MSPSRPDSVALAYWRVHGARRLIRRPSGDPLEQRSFGSKVLWLGGTTRGSRRHRRGAPGCEAESDRPPCARHRNRGTTARSRRRSRRRPGSGCGTGTQTAGRWPTEARRGRQPRRGRPAPGDVGLGDGVEQALGVMVDRRGKDADCRAALFDQLPEIHDPNGVGHVAHDREVVPVRRCRSIRAWPGGPSDIKLRIWAWMDTSRADTGSSATISWGAQRQSVGQPDALALPAENSWA